jgi:hypothetical protein
VGHIAQRSTHIPPHKPRAHNYQQLPKKTNFFADFGRQAGQAPGGASVRGGGLGFG